MRFQNLLDSLSKEDEIKGRLADLARKITVLKVNEKALTRRFMAISEMEQTCRKENNKLKNEMIEMEAAITDRISYLQRYKDMAAFKLASLQKRLDDSVPSKDLERANKEHTELTEKYRDLLEKSNHLVAKTEENSGFEAELKRLRSENDILKQELSTEKEKLHVIEAAFERLRKEGLGREATEILGDSDVISLSKKITTLELKELNERQRADHSARMYDQQKIQLRELEDRNFELESKFREITKMNLELQKTERELRDELSNAVTKEISDRDRAKILELEESLSKTKLEITTLKDIAEVASNQARALDQQQVSRDKEVTSLRQQLLDFQCQSDEKSVIGKLHRQLVQLQISEGTSVRKVQDNHKKILKLEAQLLRTERKVDEKDQTIYHNSQESRTKQRYLKSTLQEIRRRYSGAVPLPTQEQFTENLVKLQKDKANIEQQLRITNEERVKVENELIKAKLQKNGLQELMGTLKDGTGAAKVVEWHGRLEDVRLESLKYKRTSEKLQQQIHHLESVNKQYEAEASSLDEQKVRMEKELEARQLEWEQREMELERTIMDMERHQAEIASAASQFESAVGAIPDTSLPVAEQLEQATTTIKRNVKLILDARAETQASKKVSTNFKKFDTIILYST